MNHKEKADITRDLYDAQEGINNLHVKGESEGEETLIEKAYRALDEAIRCLEAI